MKNLVSTRSKISLWLVALLSIAPALAHAVDDDVVLQNKTVASGQTDSVAANATVTAGNNYVVAPGGTARFRAGITVRLTPGFHAQPGSSFTAFIDYNQNNVSDWAEQQAGSAPPYFTGFEQSDAFALGNANNQNSWFSGPGHVRIVDTAKFEGDWSVLIPSRTPASTLVRYFKPASPVMFVDFWARPHANTSTDNSTLFDFHTAQVGFSASAGVGTVQAFNGNGAGAGSWTAVGTPRDLPGTTGQFKEWTRFTLRFDFNTKKWDLYLDGQLVAYDLGFTDSGSKHVPFAMIFGSKGGTTSFDYFYIHGENPLFEDNDYDGIDDAYESSHGMNPNSASDRNTGIAAFKTYSGTVNALTRDTDGDGMPDVWELVHGLNPSVNDANGDDDLDGVTNLAEYQQGTDPRKKDASSVGLIIYSPSR